MCALSLFVCVVVPDKRLCDYPQGVARSYGIIDVCPVDVTLPLLPDFQGKMPTKVCSRLRNTGVHDHHLQQTNTHTHVKSEKRRKRAGERQKLVKAKSCTLSLTQGKLRPWTA